MPAKLKRSRRSVAATLRTSVSFPGDIYRTLEVIAKQKKVSVAWVIRDAAESYIGERWPLFDRKE